ncbi:MAG: efflux RND transporter permease subunit [Thermodesulfobacteriota bacterium]
MKEDRAVDSLRFRVEKEFEKLGFFLCRHRFATLFAMACVIIALVAQIPRITVDTSSEALLHPDDPSLTDYNNFRDEFGRAETVIVALSPPAIYDLSFLSRLKALHEDLEKNVPYLSKITSLVNVRNTRGEEDSLVVEDLLENWPETREDLDRLARRVADTPFYRDNVISGDGKTAAIIIETDALVEEGDPDGGPGATRQRYFGAEENQAVVEAVRGILARHPIPETRVAVSGGPVIVDTFNRATLSDMRRGMMMAIGVNALFLLLLFRRVTGIFLPLIVVVSAMASTIGLMPVFGVPLKMTTTIIPGFLVAVGVADSVHILAIFYRRLNSGEDKFTAIARSLSYTSLAVIMTSLTTAAGLLSFSFAKLAALGEMGQFAAAGVILALLYTIIMLPAMLAVLPIRPRKTAAKITGRMDRVLGACADFSVRHPRKIIIASAALLVVAALMDTTLRFSNNVVDYFPDSMREKQDLVYLDKHMRGVVALEAVLDSGRENGVKEPAFLNTLEGLSHSLVKTTDQDLFIGKVFSLNDILKEINKALNEDNPEHYVLPQTREAAAQELLLFESSGSDDLSKVTDSQYRKARVTMKTPWVDSVVFEEFIGRVHDKIAAAFGPDVTVSLTGEMALMARTIPATLHNLAWSYIVAFVTISLMMVLLLGNFRLGMAAMFPNALPIMLVMGVIGLLDIMLNLNTIMIGCIAIGLVVDDTMHFMYNFTRYLAITGDPARSVRETLTSTGRAMLITSLVLSGGFFVLLFSTLKNFQIFGLFTGIIILLALLADFVLAPAIAFAMYRNTTTERKES